MRPLNRRPVSKGRSVRSFNKGASRSKRPNLQPMRGGWRF